MRMTEIKIRNKGFIKLLDELRIAAEDWIKEGDKRRKLDAMLKKHLEKQNPYQREEANKGRNDGPGEAFAGYDIHKKYEKDDPCHIDIYNWMVEETKKHGLGAELTNGFPSFENMVSYINITQEPYYDGSLDVIKDISYKYLGGNSLALAAFYPPGGYIGWHNNSNAPGYNILLHYNWGGEGNFYTVEDGKRIAYPDRPNEWVGRAGDFVGFEDTKNPRRNDKGNIRHVDKEEDLSWHAAHTPDTWRFTLSTIINDEYLREDVIDEIESEC